MTPSSPHCFLVRVRKKTPRIAAHLQPYRRPDWFFVLF